MLSIKKLFNLLAVLSLFVTAIRAAQPVSETKDPLAEVKTIITDLNKAIPGTLLELRGKDINSFSEEELMAILENIGIKFSLRLKPEELTKISTAQSLIVSALKQYKITGSAFCIDTNGAFLINTLDPRFNVQYTNADGQTKTRTFQASINLLGLNLEIALRLNFIFFVGTDIDFYESSQPIQLGMGVEINPFGLYRASLEGLKRATPYLLFLRNHSIARRAVDFGIDPQCVDNNARLMANRHGQGILATLGSIQPHLAVHAFSPIFTLIPFKNTAGYMIIASLAIGAPLGSISLVRGGTLTPVINS